MKIYKVKYKARVCKLSQLKKQYQQLEKLNVPDIYKQVLLDEMKMRIEALQYILS